MPPKAKVKGKVKPKAKQGMVRKNSEVHIFEADGSVQPNIPVWVYDTGSAKNNEVNMFVKGVIHKESSPTDIKVVTNDADGNAETISCVIDNVFNANPAIDENEIHDIGMLPYQNIPCVLDYLRQRYVTGNIYATADPLYIVINPFKNVGTAGDDMIVKIRDDPNPEQLEPHTFTCARMSLDCAWVINKPQTVIVSGESGAGKTEAVKMAMRYFAAAKSGLTDATVQNALMGANPVLEAFGNAKTVRNENSSRFGRYMQLTVAKAGGISAGSVKNFLLEKSRVVHQEKQERNYHIFYQLLKSATPEQKEKWHLKDIKGYKWINPHMLDAIGMDDKEEFDMCMDAYKHMSMSDESVNSLYAIISSCILIGEIELVEKTVDGADAAVITDGSRKYLDQVARLLKVDAEAIEEGLLIKISYAGGNEIRGRWNLQNAEVLKSSFSKAIFDKLFDWFVLQLNKTIEPKDGTFTNYIGMLDIFGFEVFDNNSLEQLFINVTNEKLQKNFIDVVFDRESKLYKSEGVSTGDLIFTDNDEVLQCLIAKNNSFFSILEESCLGPQPKDENLLSMAYRILEAKFPDKFIRPKINAQEFFQVEHTVARIDYNIKGFIQKNMDVLRPDLIEVINTSTDGVVGELFAGVEIIKGKSAKGQLIASQYLSQLDALMNVINQTEPSFIRCIKPNECKTALKFEDKKTLIQLFALSVLEALQLKTIGFSYRRRYQEFVDQFKFIDMGAAGNTKLDELTKAKQILASSKIPATDYVIGKTMIFMRIDGAKWMARKQREKMSTWKPLVAVIAAALKRNTMRSKYDDSQHNRGIRISSLARRKLKGKVQAPAPAKAQISWFRTQKMVA